MHCHLYTLQQPVHSLFTLIAWIIISIEHSNNKSNNNYNRNYALSISKFNKWFESRSKKTGVPTNEQTNKKYLLKCMSTCKAELFCTCCATTADAVVIVVCVNDFGISNQREVLYSFLMRQIGKEEQQLLHHNRIKYLMCLQVLC